MGCGFCYDWICGKPFELTGNLADESVDIA